MRTLKWAWLGRQIELVAVSVLVLYAVGVGGTLNGLVRYSLRLFTFILLAVFGAWWLLRVRSRDALPRFLPPLADKVMALAGRVRLHGLATRVLPAGLRLFQGRVRPQIPRLVPPLLGVCLAGAVTTLFSSDPRRSLIYLGYFCAITLAYWIVADWAEDRGTQLEIAVHATIVILVSLSLVEFVNWLARREWYLGPPFLRLSSLMGSPNVYATVVLAAMPLAARRVVVASSRFARLAWFIWLSVLGGLLILVGSRAAWLGGAVGAVVLLVLGLSAYRMLSPPSLWKRVKEASVQQQVALAGVAAAIVAAAVFAAPIVVAQATDSTHGAPYKRVDIWNAALWQFGKTPVVGRGPFTYGDAYLERVSTPPETPHAHAHNFVLNFAAEEGVVGLAAVIWLGWAVFKAVRDRLNAETPSERLDGAVAAALVVAVLMHNMLDFTLVPGVTLLVLWALAALLPGGVDVLFRGMTAGALRRWGHPLLWLVVLWLLAFPLPAARTAREAVEAVQREDWRTAAARYEAVILRDPALTAYRFDAAYVYAQLALDGDDVALEKAVELYRDGLTRRPEYALHWANLSLLEYRSGRVDDALAHMRRAAERAPREPAFAAIAELMARSEHISSQDVPPLRGFGQGITYSLNKFHVPGPGVFLLPLPETDSP